MKHNRLALSALLVIFTLSFNLSAFAEGEDQSELAPENTSEMQDSPMPDSLPVTDNVGAMEPTPPAQAESRPSKKERKAKKAKHAKKDKKSKNKKKNKSAKAKIKKKRQKNAA